MTSIRKRLLVNVIGLFVGCWLIAATATYRGARHEVEELFDAQLAQTAAMIAELTLPDIDDRDLAQAQLSKAVYGHKYERKVSFQIWRGDTLLLRSQSAPESRITLHRGYSDQTLGDTRWRVFTMSDETGDFVICTAEDYTVRDELVAEVLESALLPLLLALPLLASFAVGIKQGLAPLQQVALEVARRSAHQLDAIAGARIPREIAPLITALNELLARLRAAFDKERRFTADVSHELRTPLASIKVQAQVAKRAADPNERRQALEKIVQGVDRSTHLVEQMLTLARLEPEAIIEQFHDIDLAVIAQDIVAELAPLALAKDVELSFVNACVGGSCRINGYAPGVASLLRNLVDNATRYTPAGGRVVIALAQRNKQLLLTVTDTGSGIPVAERERVFERFYRGADRGEYGCGLGLAIVQRIAQLHEAEVTIDDAPGEQGLRVTIAFAASLIQVAA